MNVELREFDKGHLALLATWTGRIGADAYMSHHRPLDGELVRHSPADGVLWYVIRADGTDVGTVWLERETQSTAARLGVFLGDEALFGLGIGGRAVALALEKAPELSVCMVELRVRQENDRAIACYEKCGFVPLGSGVMRRPDGGEIRYLRMERRV